MMPEKDRDYENFCCNVIWLRKHHGLSKRKMAEILEIGVGSLSKIESGIMPSRMGIGVLFAVQDYFGIHPVQMLRDRLGAE